MNEKKQIKISLSTFFLILAIIAAVIMGVVLYDLYNEKVQKENEISMLNNKIETLKNTTTELQSKVNTISNTTNANNEVIKNNIQKVIIEGTYSEGAVGHVYKFYKDGTIIESDELQESIGTYNTIGKNQIEVTLTEKNTIVNMDTGEEKNERINTKYKVTIINENTLNLKGEYDGEKYDFEITKIQD